MKSFMANFRLNLVKKNDVTLPRKYALASCVTDVATENNRD